MITTGKYLTELTHEVDVLRKVIKTVRDDELTCICWQEDGTLAYFGSDGFPSVYWMLPDGHQDESPGESREDYTSLERFIAHHLRYWPEDDLFTSPVWCVIEDVNRDWLNALLGNIQIDL
ncbi:MAG: hypothetical protein ACJ8DI_25750 [Ktedonobacteraceae bacterium]